jgi:5-hydroxyisourate hydrolase-like protein (transthyretin family)
MKQYSFLILVFLVIGLSLGSLKTVSAAEISGKVIDSSGEPVKKIIVELIPADLQTKPAHNEIQDDLTGDDGTFLFEDIAVGRYVLAVSYVWTPDIDAPYPTTFYPGVADKSHAFIFEITPEKSVQDIQIKLPAKIPELTIKGKVFLKNGKPAVNAHVRLHNQESSLVVSDCRTDKNGNFILTGFVGGEYRIEADSYGIYKEDWDSASSKTFFLNRNQKGFRLVLTSVKEKLKKEDDKISIPIESVR